MIFEVNHLKERNVFEELPKKLKGDSNAKRRDVTNVMGLKGLFSSTSNSSTLNSTNQNRSIGIPTLKEGLMKTSIIDFIFSFSKIIKGAKLYDQIRYVKIFDKNFYKELYKWMFFFPE